MAKKRFGDLIRAARERNAYSLRQLADRVEIDYSRLAKIEGGTRPAPGLTAIRRLSEVLGVEMGELLVAAGTSREVVAHLLWSERLRTAPTATPQTHELPDRSTLLEKNTYRVRVLERHGALCTVALGDERLEVLSFAAGDALVISLPPEAVVVWRAPADGHPPACTAENLFEVRVKKLRGLGQVSNLVLAGRGYELNALQGAAKVDTLGVTIGETVIAAVPATAVWTSAPEERP